MFPPADLVLKTFIAKLDFSVNSQCPGLERCGKSCRLRYINYLRPDLKRGNFSSQEESIIIELHNVLGNRYMYNFLIFIASNAFLFKILFIKYWKHLNLQISCLIVQMGTNSQAPTRENRQCSEELLEL